MADLLIRGLSDRAIMRLRAHAAEHGRMLEEHARIVLESAVSPQADRQRAFDAVDKLLGGRRFSDSTKLIRKDRER